MRQLLIIGVVAALLIPHAARAVPPPDFVFNVGVQIAQMFSLLVIFFSASMSVLLRVIQQFRARYVVVGIFVVLAVSGAAAYGYGRYRQNTAYREWLSESEAVQQSRSETAEAPTAALDKLKAESATSTPARPASRFTSRIPDDAKDVSVQFIEHYYRAIADGDLAVAYDLSKKTVPFETFASWYRKVTALTLDDLTRIDQTRSSLELTLYEGRVATRYGVLMTLALADGTPVRVAASEVRELDVTTTQHRASRGSSVLEAQTILAISNEEFRTRSGFFVLDAREDLEFENGRYPGSTHIRFADLVAGRWIELPTDRTVVVICWSGIRGREVAEFLRSKNINAVYLSKGAKGWVDAGGRWDGEILFTARYNTPQYKAVFTTREFKDLMAQGVVAIDSREPWIFKQRPIPGSWSITMINTPTADLAAAFAQVPSGSRVVTICDGYVNCFDAKITGVELEKRGHQFLGRYVEPDKYFKE